MSITAPFKYRRGHTNFSGPMNSMMRIVRVLNFDLQQNLPLTVPHSTAIDRVDDQVDSVRMLEDVPSAKGQ